MKRGKLTFALSLAVLAGLAVYVWQRYAVTTDITLLLPIGDDREAISVVSRVADSELARSMVLTVGVPTREQAAAISRDFERELRKEPRVAGQLDSLEGGPSSGSEQAVYELYHPRRLAFFADSVALAKAALSPERLRESAAALKQRLAAPMSTLISQLAPGDPTLSTLRLFERMQAAQGSTLTLQSGRFVTQDGRYAVLFLRTRARAFDSSAQKPFLEGVHAAFERVDARYQGGLTLDQSGANRFAVRMEEAISGDLERVSTLSMVGLGLLMFVLFRSARLLLVASIPLGAGTLAGAAATLAVYGNIHGVTLAFGASLLGVALDYVEHLYCHQAVSPHPDGPGATLREIGPALITGALTTLIGFAALAGSGFRGLQEVALFSSVGLCAALITTFSMLPPLLPHATPEVPLRKKIVARLARFFGALRWQRRRLWLLCAVALAFGAFGLSRARMSQDFMLGQLDAGLLAEDQRVRSRVLRFEQSRFILASGDDEESALQANDRVAEALEQATARGDLAGYQSVARLLPSATRQREVEQAVRAALGDGQELVRVFSEEGFRAEAFAPFLAQLARPAKEPLRYADVLASPIGSLVRPFRITMGSRGKRVAFLTFLSDVKQPEQLERAISAVPGARYIDQQAQLRSAYLVCQQRALQLLCVGTLGVLLLLGLRYRDLRKTLAAFVPAVLGSLVTVAVLACLGRGIDLVALAALLLVVSMGVDYGVFLVDANESEFEPTVALLSVLLAATTTVLGFGLLALSEHPMLRVIGLTAWVGMTACAVLAPTALILLEPVTSRARVPSPGLSAAHGPAAHGGDAHVDEAYVDEAHAREAHADEAHADEAHADEAQPSETRA